MTSTGARDEQLPGLARAAVRRTRLAARGAVETLAEVDPVARILVDVPLAHLDRDFDYAVPASLAGTALPGARVKVRFSGREVGGYVLSRLPESPHVGRLTPIRRVVSPEPVLTPEIAALAQAVAERYAGTRADVLRLAIPARHARVEAQEAGVADPLGDQPSLLVSAAQADWAHTEAAPAFLAHLASGGSPRAVWSAAPGEDWPKLLAQAAVATYSTGRGVLICAPDRRDVDRVDTALRELLGDGHHVALRADAGPAARYRDFLALSRGDRRIVVGTRSAAFAPVHDLGLVVLWDDGDDLYAEPRAPYPHTREVLLLRAQGQGTGLLFGGFARSAEAQLLVRSGWAHALSVPRSALRERVRVSASGAEVDPGRDPHGRGARLPRVVFEAIRSALSVGPVLVQAPRSGYAPALACDRCRTPARCTACRGPLRLPGPAAPPVCGWCGTTASDWSCVACGNRGLRAPVVGGRRTSEELGRAFPGVLVRTSDADLVHASLTSERAIVVATPGAEPVVPDGYALVVLLDAWLSLSRADLRTDEEALRRWLNAAGLVRPGGAVIIGGDSQHVAVQALVRWDPAGFADRELDERAAAHLPPVAVVATLTGTTGALDDAVALLDLPPGAELLGPTPHGDPGEARIVVRVPRRLAAELSAALGELQRLRSVRKLEPIRVQVDPVTL
jgi:primosomal protein N' (replication factor Y) (superfamily II helicase)